MIGPLPHARPCPFPQLNAANENKYIYIYLFIRISVILGHIELSNSCTTHFVLCLIFCVLFFIFLFWFLLGVWQLFTYFFYLAIFDHFIIKLINCKCNLLYFVCFFVCPNPFPFHFHMLALPPAAINFIYNWLYFVFCP